MSIWARLSEPFKAFGAWAGTVYLLDRVLRRLSPRWGLYLYEFVAQPVPAQPTLPERLAAGIAYREVPPGGSELGPMPPPEAVKAARFRQGAVALAVYRNDKYQGYVWFCFDRYEEDEVRCTYQLVASATSSFDFDLYVFPEHRLGLGFASVWHAANAYLRTRGVAYSYSRVNRFNQGTRRAHARLGALRIGSALFVTAGPVQCMLCTLRPFVWLSFSDRPGPVLNLQFDKGRARPLV